tara:strand:+ start:2851 stop:3588 length:738 start_codon:yes stop_codon:yes gene_type:complete
MPPSYCVEYAASNRATCKGCKSKIDKDTLRVGTITQGPGDYDMTAWRHLTCQKQPKGMTDAAELPGFAALKSGDQQIVRDWLSASAASPAGKKRSAEEVEALGALDGKKMKKTDLKKTLEKQGIKPTGDKGEMTEALEEVQERAKLEAEYNKLPIPKLKELLALNEQLKGGAKGELIARIVDGKMYGALPRCPECGGGLLRVVYPKKYGHGGQGRFSCPGFFDDDVFRRCPYTADSAARHAWKDE